MQVVLQFSAAGAQNVSFATDVFLQQFHYFSGTANARGALSFDSAVAVSSLGTPSANSIEQLTIALCTSAAAPSQILPNLPLPAGERVFVSVSAAGTAVIYYDSVT